MRNIRLTLQYDGSAYHGWQVQNDAETVQGKLETAIKDITGETLRVTGCGRTDAGVHARKYIANFHTHSSISASRLPYALNSHLPNDIVCIEAEEAENEFHSKNCAVGKKYLYQINCAPMPDAFLRNYEWHCRYPLNVDEMRRASKAFIGTHDFIGFSSSGRTVKTTVRTIYELNIIQNGSNILIEVVGNGFLYNMVRIITGTLVFVGSGKISADDMEQIIASGDRTRAGITAPPQGLFLTEVYY